MFLPLLLCPLHPRPQLEESREEDTEREEQTAVHHTVVAVEEVDELTVVHVRH